MDVIRTEKLTKTYGKSRGITELDLSVEKGDFYGFIGPNGAGKSTTIRTLMGLIFPTGGRAEVLGMDVTKNKEAILQSVGYLPSEAAFYTGMRVKDILKLSADLRRKNCREERSVLCERLRLDQSRKAEDLSLGNRKKAAIVCALQHRPELLILDEPTSGLDPLIQREFFKILKEYNEMGTTVFLSTHILSEVQKNCRHAAIIREGQIIANDSVENLSKTNARRVTVCGQVDLTGLKHVRDLRREANTISFLYDGDMNALIRIIAQWKIEDLTISEPDLEEIFLHYYSEGGR